MVVNREFPKPAATGQIRVEVELDLSSSFPHFFNVREPYGEQARGQPFAVDSERQIAEHTPSIRAHFRL